MRKIVAGIWLIVIVALCFSTWWKGPRFESSIMALLPLEEQNPDIQNVLKQQSDAFARRLIILIQSNTEATARQSAENVRSILAKHSNLLVENTPNQMVEFLPKPYRYTVLSGTIRQRLLHHNYSAQLSQALNQIFNPISSVPMDLLADPFSLYAGLLQDTNLSGYIVPQKGLLRAIQPKKPTFLLFYTLQQNAYSVPIQNRLMPVLEELRVEAKKQQVKINYSGLIIHAAHGTKQAKTEISTIGIGSLAGIMLLIFWVFRRILPLVYILLPVAIGSLVALTGTILLFPSVNLITFAFGAGLVGVAVDYSMHYVCRPKKADTNRLPKALVVSLALGVVSSVLAYGALALTPFPGLRQMAIFSALGLIASWITVLTWLPLFPIHKGLDIQPNALLSASFITKVRTRASSRFVTPTLIILVAISLLYISLSASNDGLAQLQTSPKSLLDEDKYVQSVVGHPYQSAFLVVTEPTLEALLQREEKLRQKLDQWRNEGIIDNYQAISQTLPSHARQQQNLALVENLYKHSLNSLFRTIGAPSSLADKASLYLATQHRYLTAAVWRQTSIGQALGNQLIHQDDGQYSSVIHLVGSVSTTGWQKLQQLSDEKEHVTLVNPIGQLSDTLKHYRVQMTQWLLLAYLVVTLLLFVRYRWQVWRIMLAPVAASALAFALAIAINGGYNLFNLMALMLVFGIGLDMGIFIKEADGDSYTWLAVSLSSLTSLLAFGLLILSRTPVLYDFGVIVLPGLLMVWLLTPLIQPISSGEK